MRKYFMILVYFTMAQLQFSCGEIIFEHDISDSYVNVLAPTNNTTLTTGNISFNWETVSDADKYQIQIATPNFANAKQIVLDSLTENASYVLQLLPNNYEWRVRAVNSAFETAYFTNVLYVDEVTDFSDNHVILVSPDNNFITNKNIQSLTWQPVDGATEYRVQIWQPDTNGALENDVVINTTALEYEFLDGNFLWQVRAQTNTQNTAYSSRSLLIDTKSPNTPELLNPVNGAAMSAGEITFNWLRNDISGSIEIDSIYLYNDAALNNLILKDRVQNKEYIKELSADDYYWNVQSFDEAGNKSSLSSTFNLIIN